MAKRMRADERDKDGRCGCNATHVQLVRSDPLSGVKDHTHILVPSLRECEHLWPPLHGDVALDRRPEDQIDNFALLLDLASDQLAAGFDHLEVVSFKVLVVH